MLTVVFGESTVSRTQVQLWYNRFKEGQEDVMDSIKHRCSSLERIREKSLTIQCELAMISASNIIMSWMSYSATWTLSSLLITSCCAGSAMSFVWRRMLRRDEYLMRGSTEVGEENDFVSVGRIKLRTPCHRLVWPAGVGAQGAEACSVYFCLNLSILE